MNISPLFSAEARRFCQTTSVRGISRIFKSDSQVLTVIWLLAVLTCTGLMFWQLALIFIKFAGYPVSTLFVESADWKNPTFPDITICNLCPLVHESDMSVSYMEYIKIIKQEYSYENVLTRYPNMSQDAYYALFGQLVEPASYFNNFPRVSGVDSIDSLPILGCNYYNWDYTVNVRYSDCLANIETIWSPEYYKCYRLKLSSAENRNIAGFSAIIYVDNFESSLRVQFTYNLINSRARGMKVAMHPSGSEPDMKLAMSVSSGTEVAMMVHQTLRQRQPQPYSNCSKQTTFDSANGNATYTQTNCIEICLQKEYIKQCGCIASFIQYTATQLKSVNNKICGNLSVVSNRSSNNWAGFQELICMSDLVDNQGECKAQCVPACREIQYTSVTSDASWPHASNLLPFYGTFLRNSTRFASQFSDFESVYEDYLQVKDVSSGVQALYADGIIQENFLQLNIQFENTQYNEQNDIPALPIEALGAQIGGVLSLWLGVTVMLLFEIGEFIYHLCHEYHRSRKRRSSHDVVTSSGPLESTTSVVVDQKTEPVHNNTKVQRKLSHDFQI